MSKLGDARSFIQYIPLLRHSGELASGVFAFTHAAEFALRAIARLHRVASTEAIHESCEFHQVCDAEERATLADDDLGMRRNEVRPLPRNRANGLIVDLQQEPHAVSVVPLTHADESSSAQWMEWMCYTHKERRRDGNVCILS